MVARLRLVLSVLIAIFVGCGRATSMTFQAPAPDELMAHADAVVQALVTEAATVQVGGDVCGTRYRATIVETFKSDRPLAAGSKIEFGSAPSLLPGGIYILVLNLVTTQAVYDRLPESEWKAPEKRDYVFSIIECGGLVPGYSFDELTQLEFRAGGFYQQGFISPRWPAAVPILRSQICGRLIDYEPLLAHLREFGAGMRSMVPTPDVGCAPPSSGDLLALSKAGTLFGEWPRCRKDIVVP